MKLSSIFVTAIAGAFYVGMAATSTGTIDQIGFTALASVMLLSANSLVRKYFEV